MIMLSSVENFARKIAHFKGLFLKKNRKREKTMPIISLTPADLLKGQLHVDGWYKGEVVESSTKPSNDKQSLNYTFVIKYATGSPVSGLEEREIKSQFNSKAMGFATPFFAALAGKTTKEFIDEYVSQKKEVKIEWEAIKGAKLQFKIENKPREDNGQLTSKVIDFAPYDYKIPF
jgi:hypothetical protein